MSRFQHKAKAVLCMLLIGSTHYWAGCGMSLTSSPDEGVVIPLTPDHAVSKALAGSQFADASAIVVFPSHGLFKLVFNDASREMSGHLSGAPGSTTISEFTFARDGQSATMQINPVTKQVSNLSASNGFNWRPVHASTTPRPTNDIETFRAANAELIALETGAAVPGEPNGPPSTPTGPGTPTTPTDGGKPAGSFPIGLFFIAGIFTFVSSVLIITLLIALIVAIINAINGSGMGGNGDGNGDGDGNGNGDGNGDGDGDGNNGATSPLPPTLVADTVSTVEDTPGVFAVLGNDSDPDGTLSKASLTVNVAPGHGNAAANTTTGEILYTPAQDYNGPDTLTYQICDDGNPQNCATASVTISVTPANDAPRVVTPIPDQEVPVEGTLNLNVAGVFTDIDAGDSIVLSATLAGGAPLPSWITFTVGNGQFAGTPKFSDRATLTVAVTATDTNNAITTDEFQLTVTPGPLFTGDDDIIDFNFISSADYLDGSQYDALAGSDNVTLPKTSSAATASGFNPLNTFFGNAGNDTIRGGDLDDLIDAGVDDDLVFGSAGNDTLEGGLGIDTLDYSLLAGAVTADLQDITTVKSGPNELGDPISDQITGFENLRGTPTGGDLLRGSAVANVIEGLGGNDAIMGRGDDDTIDGGPGTDRADFSGTPFEYAYALEAANLRVTDQVQARDGSDLLIEIEQAGFNSGSLILAIVKGTAGVDAINGTAGNDLLLAFEGADTINGSAGSDYVFGGSDANRIDYSLLADPVTVNLVMGTAAKAGGANGTDALQNIVDVVGSAQSDSITGDDAANSLTGLAGADTINGGTGDDVLAGGVGNDSLDGGPDTDRADYQGPWYEYSFDLNMDLTIAVLDSMESRDDTDSLANIERIRFSPLDDYALIGGSGSGESVDGTTGKDLLLGFGGTDTLTGGQSDDILDGGAGTDTAVLQGSILQYNYAFEHNAVKTTDTTANRDGTDFHVSIERINFLGTGIYNLRAGTNGDDAVTGTATNDLLLGFDGNDSLFGSDGSDYILGGAGTNTVDYSTVSAAVNVDLNLNVTSKFFGTFGQDQLRNISNAVGSPFNDTLSGDASPNTLSGGGGDDTIFGRESGDTLNGDANNDTLFGDVGDDTLNGGADNDTMIGFAGSDTSDGGPGTDAAAYQGSWFEYRFALESAGVLRVTDTLLSRDGSDLNQNIESLLFFNSGSLTLRLGTNNADALTGTTGDDILLGFGGGDTLTAGNGNDVLIGGANDDTLSGGANDDNFVFDLAGTQAAPGADTVTDFVLAGNDTLRFIGVPDVNMDTVVNTTDLSMITSFADNGADVLITFTGGGSIRLNGFAGQGINSLNAFIAANGNVVVGP